MKNTTRNLPYNLDDLPRESKQFYISATDTDIQEMLDKLNIDSLDNLYDSISDDVKFDDKNSIKELSYEENLESLEISALKNNIKTSFIGDSLRSYSIPKIIDFVSSLRRLSTAYTPYQPERSQGTLWSLWNYSNSLSKITGFEAINASLYDRSTALFEAASTSRKISRHPGKKFLVSKSLHPNDLEVVKTLAKHTEILIDYVELSSETGKTDLEQLKKLCDTNDYYALAFSQTNHLGIIEDFDLMTDIAKNYDMKTVCNIDVIEINKKGLKKPTLFGKEKQGVDIIIGEGQHLAIGPNFGGPGLGIFGVRYNQKNKMDIRSTPGRYVGKTIDANGDLCLCMVLSTREQHIRRDKATSNICSNQSFLASLVGAGILERGSKGIESVLNISRKNIEYFVKQLSSINNITYPFGRSIPLTQIPLNIDQHFSVKELIEEGARHNIHIGTDITNRVSTLKNSILISFNDIITKDDIDELVTFLKEKLGTTDQNTQEINLSIEEHNQTSEHFEFKPIALDTLEKFYYKLSKLNVSPDDNIYPLGSCTMKYNPYINDYNANLTNFTQAHPQAPIQDVQGSLEILFNIQERFKSITGLPGVTTQPVAGAQGELVGTKMFQAYHEDKNEKRDIILIPKSAHGTNPATATMAGIKSSSRGGENTGIILIDADENGQIDITQLKNLVQKYDKRIIGIMVTNPNTSGIFEQNFALMAKMIHEVDGLVYMDGANMNAIAGIVDLEKLGVDAVHNNLHKT